MSVFLAKAIFDPQQQGTAVDESYARNHLAWLNFGFKSVGKTKK